MGKSFFSNGNTDPESSFYGIDDDATKTHIAIKKYGDFIFTDAISPSYDLRVIPEEGYCHSIHWLENEYSILTLVAAASREKMFQLFLDLLEPLGNKIGIAIHSSHIDHNHPKKYFNEDIELYLLESIVHEYMDLLLHDGNTGIFVWDRAETKEVQWEEHKLFQIYATNFGPFEEIFSRVLPLREEMRLICNAEHVHISSDEQYNEFLIMKDRLGCID